MLPFLLPINRVKVLFKQTVQEGYFFLKKYTCHQILVVILEKLQNTLKMAQKAVFLESSLNLSCSGQLSYGEKQQIAHEEKNIFFHLFLFLLLFSSFGESQ